MTRARVGLALKVIGGLALISAILVAVWPISESGGTCGELVRPRTTGGSQCEDLHLLMASTVIVLVLLAVVSLTVGWMLSRNTKSS